VAIMGYPTYKVTLQRILIPENIDSRYCEEWLSPKDYPRFSTIFLEAPLGKIPGRSAERMWDNSVSEAKVEAYLESGGVIILTARAFSEVTQGRDTGKLAALLGFTESPFPESKEIEGGKAACRVRIVNHNSPATAHLGKKEYDWLAEARPRFVIKTTTAETLAEIIDEHGETLSPFITVNKVGRGEVYWFGCSLATPYAKRGGKPDEDTEAYAQTILQAILESHPARLPGLKKECWDPKPLGSSR